MGNTAPFDVLTFDILTRQTAFQCSVSGRVVVGLMYLKRCSQALPFSLLVVFRSFAILLLAIFFRSSALIR